jgi:hypothetical protein
VKGDGMASYIYEVDGRLQGTATGYESAEAGVAAILRNVPSRLMSAELRAGVLALEVGETWGVELGPQVRDITRVA